MSTSLTIQQVRVANAASKSFSKTVGGCRAIVLNAAQAEIDAETPLENREFPAAIVKYLRASKRKNGRDKYAALCANMKPSKKGTYSVYALLLAVKRILKGV